MESLHLASQLKSAINSDEFVVVDFYTSWCAPCKQMSIFFDKVAADYKGIKFVKFQCDHKDVSSDEELLKLMPKMEKDQGYYWDTWPTLVLFQKGKIVKYGRGGLNKEVNVRKVLSQFSDTPLKE